jgi:hypothetical protein
MKMAYPKVRSCVSEIEEGMTDGKYRKVVMDRGGIVEDATYNSRCDLTDAWYGIHESPTKMTPDNMRVRTPYCVSTPGAVPDYF